MSVIPHTNYDVLIPYAAAAVVLVIMFLLMIGD